MSKEPIDLPLLDTQTPDQTPQETKLVSRFAATTTIWKRGVPIFLGFSYTYQLLWFQLLAKYLAGQTEDNIAASGLYILFLDFCVITPTFTGLSVSAAAGEIRGKIQKAIAESKQLDIIAHQENMSRLIKVGIMQALPFLLPCMFALWYSEDILVEWLGQDETISKLAGTFLWPLGFILPLYPLRFLIEQILYVYGQEKRVSGLSLLDLIIFSIVGAPLLGIQFGMGSRGLTLAAIAENIATLILLAANLRFSASFKDFHFLRSFTSFNQQDWTQLKKLLPQGLSFAVLTSAEWFMALLTNAFAGMLGKNELGARNLISPVIGLGTMISFAFGQATLLEVGGAANHPRQAIRFSRYGLVASSLAAALLHVFILFPSLLTAFSDDVDDETSSLATQIIPLTVWSMMAYNVALNMLMSLRARQRVLPNYLFLGGLASGLPISWALGFKAGRGLQGLAEGALAGPAIAAAAVAIPFLREFKSQPAITQGRLSLTEQGGGDDIDSPIHNQSRFMLLEDAPEPPARLSSSRYGCFSRFLRQIGWYKPELPRTSNFEL